MAGRFYEKLTVKTWAVLFAFGTMMALLSIGIIVTDELADQNPVPLAYPVINEFTGVYTALLFMPLLLAVFRRFPLRRDTLLRYLPLHLLVTVLFGLTHTTLMYFSREWIYSLAGLGDYGKFYGLLKYRYLMEYQKQFLIYWIAYGCFYLYQSLRENQRQKLRAAQLEQELTESRLQALRMQLNPHFLFNTLNMISATVYEDVRAADTMIARLSELLRFTLTGGAAAEHRLEKELELVELYGDIMRARFRDQLVISCEVREDLRSAAVPVFVLQPLVENSIRYGMENLRVAEIRIAARRRDGRLILTVADNGPGSGQDLERMSRHGIGLANTAERLEQLYGNNHRLELANGAAGGLQVMIDIPFRPIKPGEADAAATAHIDRR